MLNSVYRVESVVMTTNRAQFKNPKSRRTMIEVACKHSGKVTRAVGGYLR